MLGKAKHRVFLVDDHPIVRRGFQLLAALEPDLMMCGEADNAPEALQKVLEARPELVVVDLSLKSSSGLELIKQLRASAPDLKLLVFSMRDEGLYAERALRAGANGYVAKEEGTEKAFKAIRALLDGNNYLSEKMAAQMVNRVAGGAAAGKSAFDLLSDRELEVLEMIGRGLGSREIAGQLRISIKTVESHREHVKAKLGLATGPELVRYAIHWIHSRGDGATP